MEKKTFTKKTTSEGFVVIKPEVNPKNYTVQVREQGDSVVFLRRIVPGAADKSYGIHVARLAGMPASVIDRAQTILASLEGQKAVQPELPRRRRVLPSEEEMQLSLF